MSYKIGKDNLYKRDTPSLGEFVYREVKRSIREGEYHPGERIRESDITRRLDVSRTPVREAFRRLQSEGRLTFEPQRGAVVAELDRQEVAELYALRQQLEGVAARFAAQHAFDSEIEAIEYILEQTTELHNDLRTFNQVNWEFHHAIYAAAHNRFLTRVFASLSDPLALLRGELYIPPGRSEQIYQEHRRIVEAIKARDPDAADRAAQDHIVNSFKTHLEARFQIRVSRK